MRFRQKKHEITGNLVVVAFVQDEESNKVLESVRRAGWRQGRPLARG